MSKVGGAGAPVYPFIAVGVNLAQLLQDTIRLAEAEPLTRRAAQIFLASYGKDHPQTRLALDNYVRILTAMGQSDAEVACALDPLTEAAS